MLASLLASLIFVVIILKVGVPLFCWVPVDLILVGVFKIIYFKLDAAIMEYENLPSKF